MKVLSRAVSPAGFGLVVLLFFLLPFVSVSCDFAGEEIGAFYHGSDLVAGTEPTPVVPDEFRDAIAAGGTDSGDPEPAPDPNVQILAIITVVLAVLGILTALISRLRARLFGTAGVALATLAAAIVTMVVAQSNLESALLADAEENDVSGDVPGLEDIAASVDRFIHTEVGFWLVAVLLGLIAVANLGVALIPQRPAPQYGVGPPPPQPSPPDPAPAQPPAEQPPPGGST